MSSDRSNNKPSQDDNLITVGWREWATLPTLSNQPIKAKVDTGARTSALHAFSVQPIQRDGADWVRFSIHPNQHDSVTELTCELPVHDRREVSDSGGHKEMRYVILTDVIVGEQRYPIEITLTARDSMAFRMLLGRTAMDELLVNPTASFLLGGDTDSPKE